MCENPLEYYSWYTEAFLVDLDYPGLWMLTRQSFSLSSQVLVYCSQVPRSSYGFLCISVSCVSSYIDYQVCKWHLLSSVESTQSQCVPKSSLAHASSETCACVIAFVNVFVATSVWCVSWQSYCQDICHLMTDVFGFAVAPYWMVYLWPDWQSVWCGCVDSCSTYHGCFLLRVAGHMNCNL